MRLPNLSVRCYPCQKITVADGWPDVYASAKFSQGGSRNEAIWMDGMEPTIAYLKDVLRPGDLLLTLGAGDVWKVGNAILKDLGK